MALGSTASARRVPRPLLSKTAETEMRALAAGRDADRARPALSRLRSPWLRQSRGASVALAAANANARKPRLAVWQSVGREFARFLRHQPGIHAASALYAALKALVSRARQPTASARISVSPVFHSGGRGARRAERQWSRATRELHGDVSDLNARFEPNAALDHKSAARPGVLVLRVPVRCVASRASSRQRNSHAPPSRLQRPEPPRFFELSADSPVAISTASDSRGRRAEPPRATALRPQTSVGRHDSLLDGADKHRLSRMIDARARPARDPHCRAQRSNSSNDQTSIGSR